MNFSVAVNDMDFSFDSAQIHGRIIAFQVNIGVDVPRFHISVAVFQGELSEDVGNDCFSVAVGNICLLHIGHIDGSV